MPGRPHGALPDGLLNRGSACCIGPALTEGPTPGNSLYVQGDRNMSSKPASPKQPAKTDRQRADDPKAERLAAALRDNLERRKAQQRARDAAAGDQPAARRGRSGDA